ncbi:MAG: SdpI family protein [Oscillospiraceae bacterium]|nr:SdpI family protein [Oscillospiraceae bacterium]
MNWFWFFGLAMVLLIPASMCIAGLRWQRGKIPRYGGASGYCTKQSQRSPAAWAFAHLYFGRLWTILGAAMALLGIVTMLLCIGGDKDSVGVHFGIACGVQTLAMLLPILPTERALRRRFGPM